MNSFPTIRLLESTGATMLENVAPEVFDHAIDPRWSAEFLADPRHHLAVAIADGQVVGMSSAVHYVHPDKQPELWINEVGVAPVFRNRGVGKALLRALLDHARVLGCKEAWVATESKNTVARRLYASAGGTEDPAVHISFRLDAAPLPSDTTAARITFAPTVAEDFEELATVRTAAMRESLEKVGRFDPGRSRERLRKSFYPDHSQWILFDGCRIGFYTFRPVEDGFALDHLYVHPDVQSQGIGSVVMRSLNAEADRLGKGIRLGALRDSDSNRFYQRHGFVKTSEDEWDIYYQRHEPAPA